jgi:hypothetical protein
MKYILLYEKNVKKQGWPSIPPISTKRTQKDHDI